MRTLVGIDVQPVDEVEASLRTFGSRYTKRLFTDQELLSCEGGSSAAMRLAARFAAKEAVLKALDTSRLVPRWRDIEVQSAEGGRPEIALRGEAAELARRQGVKHLSLSLSHTDQIAVAAVVIEVGRQPWRSRA